MDTAVEVLDTSLDYIEISAHHYYKGTGGQGEVHIKYGQDTRLTRLMTMTGNVVLNRLDFNILMVTKYDRFLFAHTIILKYFKKVYECEKHTYMINGNYSYPTTFKEEIKALL